MGVVQDHAAIAEVVAPVGHAVAATRRNPPAPAVPQNACDLGARGGGAVGAAGRAPAPDRR